MCFSATASNPNLIQELETQNQAMSACSEPTVGISPNTSLLLPQTHRFKSKKLKTISVIYCATEHAKRQNDIFLQIIWCL